MATWLIILKNMIRSSSIVKTFILLVAIYTSSTTNQLDNNVHSIFRQWDQISPVPIYRKLRGDNCEPPHQPRPPGGAWRTPDAGAVMVVRHSDLWYTSHVTRGVVTRGVMSEFSVTFLVLVNSKSGGQDGPHLLEKFTEIFREVSSRLWDKAWWGRGNYQ